MGGMRFDIAWVHGRMDLFRKKKRKAPPRHTGWNMNAAVGSSVRKLHAEADIGIFVCQPRPQAQTMQL
jgi:hypothetical protein